MRSNHLTKRCSQLRERSRAGALAGVMTTFNFMKQFPVFATLTAASGGSAPSRYIKSHFMSRAVLAIAVIIGCSAVADAKPPAVSLSGGDGSSFSRAIVVKAPTDRAGVDAQHDYIAKHFGKWRSIGVKLVEHNKPLFDIMSFTTADGKKHTLYFDISNYYGKL